jgi:ABC-type branched-subunit amino acid transport system substrate-binding protein
MRVFGRLVQSPHGTGGARLVLGLGAVSVWLVLAAVVGALTIGGDSEDASLATDGVVEVDPSTGLPVEQGPGAGPPAAATQDGTAPQPQVDSVTGQTVQPGAPGAVGAPGAPAAPGQPAGPAQPAPGSAPTGASPAAPSRGDRTGVTASEIGVGVHAPVTINGAPINLSEDPLKGLRTYVEFLNRNGGINGRKIKLEIADDRFDTAGAQAAADQLVNSRRNFVVSGTLGIDQIAVVAAEAARRGVPYTAAGGSEEVPIPAMYQLGTSYTTHALELADYIAADPSLRGKRVGVVVSDSEYIRPVADTFVRRLKELGQTVSTVVAAQKPQQNPDYNGYILRLRQARTEVFVPLTDPLTTSQMVQRCAAGAACGWRYTFSNFAHDTDTALALMAPTWANQKVRGLSGACYYLAPEVDGRRCGAMRTARDQYIAINGEGDWRENGSGASFGYQIVGFLKGALAAPGADLTRERFRAALADTVGYADVITSPITFRGSKNRMHGSELMTVLEAQQNNRYRMVTPGFVEDF